MLVIREAQLSDMRREAVDRFAAELQQHLQENYSQACKAVGGEEALGAFVRRGMERARQNGIEHRGALTVLLELLIQFGENFERSPVREFARNLLTHPVLPGDAKVNAIRDRHDERTLGRIVVPF